MTGQTARRLSLGLAVTAAAATASAVYQKVGEARDRRRHPPPGRLVDVGGRRLHIVCAGQGSPAVIIIPALSTPAGDDWPAVQRALARDTTVCVYDRAGVGWSDPPRRRRTGIRMAEELHTLLGAAGISPPYVLVGHSMGGLIAQLFAALYPAEVAGVVLVDSSHPHQDGRLPREYLRHYWGGTLLVAGRKWLRPLGVVRAARDLGVVDAGQDGLSARERRADAGELLALKAVLRDTDRLASDLGSVPLTVLTSSELDPNREPGTPWYEYRARFYPVWIRLQAELAALSTDSRHIVAERAGHHIHRDDPELVIGAIRDLVVRAGSARGPKPH
jgi:pimeloyl-ACP methyl ester carboxylesterase